MNRDNSDCMRILSRDACVAQPEQSYANQTRGAHRVHPGAAPDEQSMLWSSNPVQLSDTKCFKRAASRAQSCNV